MMNRAKRSVIKVLLIDDDEDDYILTEDIINDVPDHHYQMDWVNNYDKGLEAILSGAYDVYLLDFRLGRENGLELLRETMQSGASAPLILLTGLDDRTLDMKAMEAGASDFLVKTQLNPQLLDRSIRYAIQQRKNIQELRQKEEQLQELNNQLEQKVKARTAELAAAHEELQKALAVERQLSELKSRFVSMASHEFKTPLTSILSSASLIERYPEGEQQEKRLKHINRIKSSVNNLTNILSDFLSLEQIESGGVSMHPKDFKISEFISDLQEDLSPLLKKDQTFHVEMGGEDEIYLDRHLLRNILINLISNAIKYSGEGTTVHIRLNRLADILQIEVEDEGIGIPEEEKEHMFERFFRAKNATNIQGTGLGLTIVKRYLDLMNGRIDFKSVLNKGTTFEVVIPIAS